MVGVAEASGAKPELAAGLAAGVETLSLSDSVVFTQYTRLVLPLDGFVFWVRTGLINPTALLNIMGLNQPGTMLGQPLTERLPPLTKSVKGSLHYATTQDQNEDETPGVSTVIFTALSPIQEFNDVQPNTLWIGKYAGDREGDDGPITFAFSQRGKYYKAADLYHYSGTAVIPVFAAQLIDTADQLAGRELIVSNSLPAWLSLNGYQPPYPGFTNTIPLYPSFLVPDNLPPPYGSVHIIPELTQALTLAPVLDSTLGQAQMTHDRVRITLYGLTNQAALTFLSAVQQFSYDLCQIGFMSVPVIRDEKRGSNELNVIAMKKTIEVDVAYDQATMRNVARQMIERTIVDYQPQPLSAFAA